jgi:hypothetical protein
MNLADRGVAVSGRRWIPSEAKKKPGSSLHRALR